MAVQLYLLNIATYNSVLIEINANVSISMYLCISLLVITVSVTRAQQSEALSTVFVTKVVLADTTVSMLFKSAHCSA